MHNQRTGKNAGTNNVGVYNESASPSMNNVTATATGGINSTGVYSNTSSSPSMNNVTASATGGTNSYGVYNESGSPSMNNVTATATGGTRSYGVYNYYQSSPSMTNVTASATGGTNSYGVHNSISSLPTIRNSSITGTTKSIFNESFSWARVADTALGGAVAGTGFTCVGVYTTDFVAFTTTGCV